MSEETPHLVLADDDETVRNLLTMQAERGGFTVQSGENGAEALDLVTDETDVVLLDLQMPVLDGFGALERLAREHPEVPAVVLTSVDEAAEAVKAMKLGALDYLTKPFDPDELLAVLRNARRLRNAERENEQLREVLGGRGPEVEIVAESEAMQEVLGQAVKVASLDSTILLTGESGVGKSMLARHVHANSERREQPFVTVSCPALPRELLESELFGHEKGAFTGAVRRRRGKIEMAKGGTLFLEEIGDLPIDLQPKLLSVLQERQFQRLGGEETLEADVRIIAATNLDLEQRMKDGQFREDLFYRLSVIPIEVPPLRERLEELRELSDAMLGRIARQGGRRNVKLSKEALAAMQAYDWPGNVRQLENVLERAAALCEEGAISVEDLPGAVRGSEPSGRVPAGIGGIALSDLEREALVQTLKICNGNKAETARRLEVTEKSIYNKLKRHGLM
ncbi:MAG: sigma-54 dependent transcriptional regulator [Verrucomicrobiota bacterium]|nr:sigma-54 dependent transcriptional regulator [Verrucomicrobiota bacterium]